jgi:hypothetical protein
MNCWSIAQPSRCWNTINHRFYHKLVTS